MVTTTQMRDALVFAEALGAAISSLPDSPSFGGGERLYLPTVIPLRPDYPGEGPVVWLVANDFDGYDVQTSKPESGN